MHKKLCFTLLLDRSSLVLSQFKKTVEPVTTGGSFLYLLTCLLIGVSGLLTVARAQSNAQTLRITMTTGTDDLRSGQVIFASVYMQDSRQDMPEVYIVDGVGLANRSIYTSNIPLGRRFKPTDFRAIELIVDGAPKQAFQTYDNWNLNRIRVELIEPSGSILLLNVSGEPLMRFTSEATTRRWNLSPQAGVAAGSSANGQEMSGYDLMQIKIAIRSEADNPLAAAKTWIRQRNRTMTITQVRSLMDEFRQEAEKFGIVQACMPYVRDRQTLSELTNDFTNNEYRRQITLMTKGQ